MIRIIRTRLVVLLFIVLFLLAFPGSIYAQVVINEFGSKSNPEWVEFYNTGSSDIQLDGWTIFFQDNPDTTQKNIFGLSDMIPAGGFKTFEHTFFGTAGWLRDDGDLLILMKQNGEEENRVAYGDTAPAVVGSPSEGKSAGRVPDGSTNNWQNNLVSSEGGPNPTPTPSPSATATATATAIATAAATSTPVATPTSTPTKKPTPKPTPTPQPEILGEQASDAALAQSELSKTSTPEVDSNSGKKFPVPAIIFILSGVGLVGFSIYSFVRASKKGYTNGSENTPPQIF